METAVAEIPFVAALGTLTKKIGSEFYSKPEYSTVGTH